MELPYLPVSSGQEVPGEEIFSVHKRTQVRLTQKSIQLARKQEVATATGDSLSQGGKHFAGKNMQRVLTSPERNIPCKRILCRPVN